MQVPPADGHVRPLGPINNIGKEANRWEEQFYLGADPEAQVDYATTAESWSSYLSGISSADPSRHWRQVVCLKRRTPTRGSQRIDRLRTAKRKLKL